MNNLLLHKTPHEVTADVATRMRALRKAQGYSQKALSEKAGVSFASLRRFESTGEIALTSLVKLAIALGCENDFDGLFAHRHYSSIQEVIDARQQHLRSASR